MASLSDTTLHHVVPDSERAPGTAPPSPAAMTRHPPGDLLQLGFVAQLCLAADDIDQALQLACRFSPLWSRRRFDYERTRSDVEVRARGLPQGCQEHTLDTLDLALTWVRLVERLSGGAASPRAVGAPACCRPRLRLVLHCPIHDSSGELSVRFAIEDVGHKNSRPDLGLSRLLAAYAEQRLAELKDAGDTRARARRALARLMGQDSAVRVETLARELSLGVRTLHRRLRAEGTSFRLLVVEHRLEHCVSQFGSCATSAKQVAFELGFADPASFHRAFKRWTGQTVGQYREVNASQLGAASR